jgi:hypothetical protein
VLHCVVLEDKDSVVVLLLVLVGLVVLFLDALELELDEMTGLLVVTALAVMLEVLLVAGFVLELLVVV